MSQSIEQWPHSGCVLSKREIKAAIERGEIRFDPSPEPSQFAEASVNLRLGYKFTQLKEGVAHKITLGKSGIASVSDSKLWTERTYKHFDSFNKRESHCLEKHEFILGQTLERVWVPRSLIARVEGRSSYARVGLTVHQTAPWLQPGWNGQITLEFFNCGPFRLDLTPMDDAPCQITFFRLSSELPQEEAYGSRATDSFQHQESPLSPAKPA